MHTQALPVLRHFAPPAVTEQPFNFTRDVGYFDRGVAGRLARGPTRDLISDFWLIRACIDDNTIFLIGQIGQEIANIAWSAFNARLLMQDTVADIYTI